MAKAEPTKVYPIPGRLAVGVPLAVTEFPSKGAAEEFLAANPAFASSEAEATKLAFSTPEATPADESVVVRGPGAPAPAADDEEPEKPPTVEASDLHEPATPADDEEK